MHDIIRVVPLDASEPIKRFEDDLKHVLDDPRWERVDGKNRLRFRQIGAVRIGVVLATHSQKYSNFALNCAEMDRLRKGKSDGRIDLMVVVAVKDHEWCAHAEAAALYERVLQHKTPVPGQSESGPFWTLDLAEIQGKEAPF